VSGYDLSDTIVAPATPAGRSALGVVRLSGPRAWDIALSLAQRPLRKPLPQRAYILRLALPVPHPSADPQVLVDNAVVTLWANGHSYTDEPMVELALHGNPLLIKRCVAACVQQGARLAEPGEFTFRAYLSGKLDLAQAEAVQQLIGAGSTRALQLAATSLAGQPSAIVHGWVDRLTRLLASIEVIHDYAASDLDASLDLSSLLTTEHLLSELGELTSEMREAQDAAQRAAPLREGITVAICGPPNVGKSTLFNALLGHERALTAPEPGTTRDYLSESLEAEGLKLTLVDTAGYRETADALEAAGVRRSGDWARSADRVLWVTAADAADGTGALPAPQTGDLDLSDALHVMTRCDLLPSWPKPRAGVIHVSGLTGQGVQALWEVLHNYAAEIDVPATLAAFSERQAARISEGLQHLEAAASATTAGLPFDAVATDLYSAREAFHGVYERADRSAVIEQVFASFCVGK